jgi:peptidase C25-like protein
MRLTKRTNLSVTILLLLFGLICILVLPGLPVGRAATTPRGPSQKVSTSGLDGARQAAMEKLYGQLKSGDSFSEEEGIILRRFAAGGAITDLEADLVISRALYDFYVLGKELTKEQEDLFDRYSLFVARRPTDVADLKTQLLEKRRAAAATAPPHVPQLAPPNDLCAGAEVIPGAGPFPFLTTVTSDITDATVTGDPPLPSCQTNVSRSIWYRFTPSATATYTFSSCASDGTASTVDDLVMAIYTSSTGACGGVYTQLPSGCDDDSCVSESLQAILTDIPLLAGTNYFIVVWQFDTPAPTVGNTAVQLNVVRKLPPANDTCGGATLLPLNTPLSGTNFAAFNDYQLTGTSCFTGVGQTSSSATGVDVVYSFTAPSTNVFSFKVTNYSATGNLVMYATNSCPAATPGTPVNITCNNVSGPAFVASNRPSASTSEELMCVSLTSGQQIFIFVDDATALPTFGGSPFTIEASTCTRETEANNTPATANSFGSQAFGIEGSITPAGDIDFYSLGSPTLGSRVFALVDSVASATTDLDMRVTTTVDTLEFDDLNADALFGTLGPAIGGTPVPATGPVFLRVNHNSAATVAEPYRLYYKVQPAGGNTLPNCSSITTSATAETEPNNTAAQANTAGNLFFSGELTGPAPSTDLDVFSFSATAGQLVFLSLDSDPCRDNTPINARLELLDTNGSTVLVNVNDGGSTSSTTSGAGSLTSTTPSSPSEGIAFRVSASGTYFARVSIGTTSTGGTGAGDYLLSISAGGPTAAKFYNDLASSAASATRFDDGVSVRWRTGFEVDNLGFNLYRDENGKRMRVNSDLIAGSALMVGAGTSMGAGRSYAVFDNAVSGRSAQYLIEAIDLNGESTWYGPFGANQATGKAGSGDLASSPTLGQLGKSNPMESQTTRVERRASIRMVSASGVSIQAGIGGPAAAKLGVKSEGFYRVTQPELVAAGFNANVDPRNLRLLVDGQEQPINVIAKGVFDSSSAIEFYGIGVDSAATDEHVYWLIGGAQPGQRIQSIPAASNPAISQSFLSSVELKQRTVYFSALRNGDKENFFGSVIAHDPVDQSLTLQHVDTATTNSATLEVALQGVTLTGHRVEVQINGARAGEVVFNGQDAGIARLSIGQSLIKEGTNIVRLVPLGGPPDISLVDYVRLNYWHTFVADNNQLRFNASSRQIVTVDGFNNADIRVFDVTNPNAPQEMLGAIRPGKAGYSVSIKVQGSGLRALVAMTNDSAKPAANITLDRPSSWRQPSNAANFVIFTHREFMLTVEPLRAFRQSQGYKVAVVDVEDAYDEFSFGNKTPQAIKDFLAYARGSWKTAPRFVMLAGDASFDAKNYLGFGSSDLVPTRLIDTQLMETSSDDALADFNGDGLAEMALGRLPIRSPRDGAAMVAKIIGYETMSRLEGVLLVADDSLDGVDFEATSAELRGLIPPDQRVEEINRGSLDPSIAKSRLLEAINRGQRLINYNGHGNVDTWRGGLLTAEDVSGLSNNDRLSLFIMMTCLNGYFHDAQLDSLAESLLRAENVGAVAVWASSGMTQPGDQGVMDLEMFRRLFDPANTLTIGEVALRAKTQGLNKDARLSWVLFGDPTTRLK